MFPFMCKHFAVLKTLSLLIACLCCVWFVCAHQLITAFEKALVLIDPAPGEDHKKVSADYVKCLSLVSESSRMSTSP